MTFAEKMQLATLVLDYLKVVLGSSVTIPALVLALCVIFRDQIREALDALREITFPGGSAKLEKRRVEQEEIVQYRQDMERTETEVTAASADHTLTPNEGTAERALISFWRLAARLLPLVPKGDRRWLINNAFSDLPTEYEFHRTALLDLSDDAPDIQALKPQEVLGATIAPPKV